MTTFVSRILQDKAVCTKGTGILLAGPDAAVRTVFVEGAPIALVGDQVFVHGKKEHKAATVVTGLATVLADGRSVVTVFQNTTCGGVVATGAKSVIASEYISPEDMAKIEEAGLTTDVPGA